MLELLMKQIIASMKDQGLDPADIKAKIETVVNDVHAMKQSQDRTEAMVAQMHRRVCREPAEIELRQLEGPVHAN